MTSDVTIAARISRDLRLALKKRAAEEHTTMSTVARQAIDQYLNPKNNASISPTNMKNNTSDFQDFMELYQLFKELKG